jgi:hypothetical protein
MTDFLDEKRNQIADRLKQLKPLVDEYRRLEAAASALAAIDGSAPAGAAAATAAATTTAGTAALATRRRPGRPRSSVNRASAAAPGAAPVKAARPKPGRRKGRGGRRKGSGTRAAQALSVVQGRPGITIPELAAEMAIQTTYLYRVLPGLEQEGKVEKKGRGWWPREG